MTLIMTNYAMSTILTWECISDYDSVCNSVYDIDSEFGFESNRDLDCESDSTCNSHRESG